MKLKTSSVAKKAEASAIKAQVDIDSTRPRYEVAAEPQPRRPIRRSNHLAYEVAASAASYVQARARGQIGRASCRERGYALV